MEETVNVGIVGAGSNTKKKHIPGFRSIPDVCIKGVCNRTRKSSEKVAQKYDIPKVYNTWKELVEDQDVDAVLIGTWPYLHCPITINALEAGKHVLCEARMAMNQDEARRMLDCSISHPELVAQIVPSPLGLSVEDFLRKLLYDREIGDVLIIEVRHYSNWIDYHKKFHWREDPALSGHNVLTVGIWYETLLRWFGEAIGVMALGKRFVKQGDDNNGHIRYSKTPDHLDIIAEMASGSRLQMHCSDVRKDEEKNGMRIFGTKGELYYSLSEDTLQIRHKNETTYKKLEIPETQRDFWRAETEFINAIRGKENVTHTDFTTGVKYMEFTEAVWRSMNTGKYEYVGW